MKKQIEYSKILDTQWALRRSELKAKTYWDEMYQAYGKKDKDDLLTQMAYETVKELRQAQKSLSEVTALLRKNDQLEYTS